MKFDYKIPRNVKQKWIRALRSGRYARGKVFFIVYVIRLHTTKAKKCFHSVLGVARSKKIAEPQQCVLYSKGRRNLLAHGYSNLPYGAQRWPTRGKGVVVQPDG